VADLDAAGDVGTQHAEPVQHGVIDRLQRSEAVTDLGDVRPGLRGVVVDDVEDPHPAVLDRPGHRAVGAPAQVRRSRHDRSLVQPLCPPPGDPLRVQQAFTTHQPQHPFPGDMHLVLATQPARTFR